MNRVWPGSRALLIAGGLMAPAVVLGLAILWLCGGQLYYSLDDPYIHLALAEQIGRWHYGINSADVSAPSSSMLWPFLLAPFAGWAGFVWMPLLINLTCLYATLALLAQQAISLGSRRAACLVGIVAVALNFYGVAYTGMEHSLQVLLAAAVALFLSAFDRDPYGRRGLIALCVALVALPLVRYEGLAISVPVCGYLFWRGEKRAAAITLAAITVCLLGFSVFLKLLGLGYVPSSILVKSEPGLGTVVGNIKNTVQAYGWLLALALPFAALCFARRERPLVVTLAAAVALHCLFGRNGWFGRYELYILAFAAVFVIQRAVLSRPRLIYALALLPLAFYSLLAATVYTPWGASNIANQQGRISVIAASLDAPVAVNDLGLVSLRSDAYVLDLYGLGSLTALRARRESPNDSAWIEQLMQAHDVQYAFIYDGWFPNRPEGLIKVADFVLTEPQVTVADTRVALYARDAAHTGRLRAALDRYAQAQPSPSYRIAFVND